ncbi:MAG: o-succinylbenzoate synthase [Bacteroidetes bacterium]|nr:o-succinylbenzoate synthase [Bacteroidota bacterium]
MENPLSPLENPTNLTVQSLELRFKQPARTSRNTMLTRKIWVLTYGHAQGECAPLPGLSPDWVDEAHWNQVLHQAVLRFNEVAADCGDTNSLVQAMDKELDSYRRHHPSLVFGFESLLKQLSNKAESKGENSATLPVNGLVWMNEIETMRTEAHQKVQAGYSCIKLKIGALDWLAELDLLQELREAYPSERLQIRVDANGALDPDTATMRMEALQKLGVHSIEQPLAVRYDALLPQICQNGTLPVALDESLLVRYPDESSRDWLAQSGVAFLVLKPGLLGGFRVAESWIQTAESLGLGWWITSALESNIGLQALALWTLDQTRRSQNPLAQGLGTGSLFTNNFPSTLQVQSGILSWGSLS